MRSENSAIHFDARPRPRPARSRVHRIGRLLCVLAAMSACLIGPGRSSALSQSGRRSSSERGGASEILNVIVELRPGQKEIHLTREKLELWDAGIGQQIEAFHPDYSAARIALVVDDSESLRADVAQLAQVVKAFASQLYEGDQLMVIAYNESPEVIEDFTADRNKLDLAGGKFKKADSPKMWDALQATLDDALRMQVGYSKRIIVLVSDGFDRGSMMPYQDVIANLERENIVIYALQADDRTRGASRRKTLKPEEALTRLTEGTGGKIYPLKEADRAAKEILQEVSEQWYQLIYKPQGINPLNTRKLLLIPDNRQLKLRTKIEHPGEKNL